MKAGVRRLARLKKRKGEIGRFMELVAVKGLAKLRKKLDADTGFCLSPQDIKALAELGRTLQAEADSETAAKDNGINALAASIKGLAEATIEGHKKIGESHRRREKT
jgi:hypothetical protein